MLAKHDKSVYKVTEKKRCTFKYLPGASRSCTEAMDKIISEKLKKIKIFIDMKNVEKLPVSTHEASLENSTKDGSEKCNVVYTEVATSVTKPMVCILR
ncbi:hypothetical protein BDR04DRAFT_1089759 [Suillus decipiens]|nr:hypothetical protein BDR04DRAFT_1089759 [Suillus decipiens]